MKIPSEPTVPGSGTPHGAGAFNCFECVEGVYVPCERPTCDRCGAQPPTKVRKVLRELAAA